MSKEIIQSIRLLAELIEFVNFGHLDHLCEVGPHPSFPGHQLKYRFPNGYGASVVRWSLGNGFASSYGAESGLWELAVLDASGKLCYSTPVTDDVLGWLSPEDINAALSQIQVLPACGFLEDSASSSFEEDFFVALPPILIYNILAIMITFYVSTFVEIYTFNTKIIFRRLFNMSKTKRKIPNFLKFLLSLIVVCVFNTCTYTYFLSTIDTSEIEIKEAYQDEIEKYAIVKEVADASIKEGIGVFAPSISYDDLMYEISNDGDIIHARFWINEERADTYPYSAWVKLSQDYEILESHYPEEESFELFTRRYEIGDKLMALLYSLEVFFVVYVVGAALYGLFYFVRWLIRTHKIEKEN